MSNIIARIEKFREHKLLSQELNLREKYLPISEKKAERTRKCGSVLKFDIYANKETGEVARKLIKANFCSNRFCPMCAWIKTKKLANEMKSVLQQIEDKKQVAYIFLTLTIKNPPLKELRATLKTMSDAFNKMTKEEAFEKAIKGYIRAFEFLGDHTKAGEAHPHIHAVLVVDKNNYFKKSKDFYISQEKWSYLWGKALGVDYLPIVDVRKIKAKNSNWKDSDSAVFETIKYCVAPLEIKKMSEEHFKILDEQTKNIRQYNKGGLIKSTKPKEEDHLPSDLWDKLEIEIKVWIESKKDYE